MKQFRCKNCGASLSFGAGVEHITCPYCNTHYPKPQPSRSPSARGRIAVLFILLFFLFSVAVFSYIAWNSSRVLFRSEADKALDRAMDYLEEEHYSYNGLIDRLENFYSYENAKYAADNCGADWQRNAVLTAEDLLREGAYSQKEIQTQLAYKKFTQEEIRSAIAACGADWIGEAEEYASRAITNRSISAPVLKMMKERLVEENALYPIDKDGRECRP